MNNPVKNPIELACGMLKGDGNEVGRFMARKRREIGFSPKSFGELPDIFLKPVGVENFDMYSREELNAR